MTKWTSLLMLAVCVVAIAGVAVSNGQDSDEQSMQALAESWSSYESSIFGRVHRVRPGSHKWARLDLIGGDIVRSPSLNHPIVGILEIQAQFAEDSSVTKPIPGGSTSRMLIRIVSYRLTFSPKNGAWELVDGVATMVWSVDDGNDHPGERVKIDLEVASYRFGIDLIAQLFNDDAE